MDITHIKSTMNQYNDFAEKKFFFGNNVIVNTEEELEQLLTFLEKQQNIAFRGVKEAKFKMYSSSQLAYSASKHINYSDYIQQLIDKVKSNKQLQQYFDNKKILTNDFLYMALLQHYGHPSPLLDFSYSLKSALYFMLDDGAFAKKNNHVDSKEETEDSIDHYRALYIINTQNAEFISIEDINKDGSERANTVVEIAQKRNNYNIIGLSEQTDNSFRHLPYRDYCNIKYFSVKGGVFGKTMVSIPALNFLTEYDITNPRIQAQSGMFIYNSSSDEPLEQLVYKNSKSNKHICCINIHKKLSDKIRKQVLFDKTKDDIYPKDKESYKIRMYLLFTWGLKPTQKRKIMDILDILLNNVI